MQISMSVRQRWTTVMTMPTALTLLEVFCVPATLDILEMALSAMVSAFGVVHVTSREVGDLNAGLR